MVKNTMTVRLGTPCARMSAHPVTEAFGTSAVAPSTIGVAGGGIGATKHGIAGAWLMVAPDRLLAPYAAVAPQETSAQLQISVGFRPSAVLRERSP